MILSYDSECFLSRPGAKAAPLVCGQWKLSSSLTDSQPSQLVHARDPRFKSFIVATLADPTIIIAGHFVAYDMAALAAQWPELLPAIFHAYAANRIVCTAIRQVLADLAKGLNLDSQDHSLSGVLKTHTGEALDKGADTWRTRYGQLYHADIADWPEPARVYALKDADSEHAVYWAQEREYGGTDILADQYARSRTQWWLHLQSCWGIRTDLSMVQAFHRETLEGVAADRAIAEAAGLIRPDGTKDTKAAMRRMVETMTDLEEDAPLTDGGDKLLKELKGAGLSGASARDVYEQYGKGISLDEDACLASGDDVLEAYQRYGSLNTTLTRVERLYRGVDLPLQARFNPLIATGRTSCTMGDPPKKDRDKPRGSWGFQLQNLNRKGLMRECFIPRSEYLRGGR